MIRVEHLRVVKLRGIVDMSIDLGGRNHVVFGPNGTGKSGVVDALEFVLTGEISRLAGTGRGNLSVLAHGPHVDHSATPEEAFVEAGIRIGKTGPVVLLRRSVAGAKSYTLVPEDATVRKMVDRMKGRREVALSRREIIKFVIAEPGKRAADVQALLKLDELEGLRKQLQRIARSEEKSRKDADVALKRARVDLCRAMEIEAPDEETIVTAANARRAILSLPPLVPGADLALDRGLAEIVGSTEPLLGRALCSKELEAVKRAIGARSEAGFRSLLAEAGLKLERLRSSEALLADVVRDTFYERTLDLFDGQTCPACDTPWEANSFVELVMEKRESLKRARELRKDAESSLRAVAAVLEAERDRLRSVFPIAKRLLPEAETHQIADHGKAIADLAACLESAIPVNAAVNNLRAVDDLGGVEILDRLEASVEAIPEATAEPAAHSYLVTAHERYSGLKGAERELEERTSRAERAQKVFDIFKTTTSETLEGIYRKVQDDFATLYRLINSGDEDDFEAKMTPSLGKLGFDVDFYGRGRFPPGAFHSEGHQDGMGLCLYLALMRHIMGEGFTFAALDDVMMSIDSEHRRGVLDLLRSKFSNTQFVVTTHDKVWAKHLTSHGFIRRGDSTDFRKWTVDDGPTTQCGNDWVGIRRHLEEGDIRAAAGALRASLEYLAAEYCEALQASVPYRSNGAYDLGTLFPSATARMKKLLREARVAAASWDRSERVEKHEAAFVSAVTRCDQERWQINPAVHHNEWEDFTQSEFERVIDAYESLCRLFGCNECGSLLRVEMREGKRAFLQCSCGANTFSFAKKKAPRR